MNDLVSRQAAIDIADKYSDSKSNGADVAMDIIAELIAAPPAQQWHPITRRPMDEEERKEWTERLSYTLNDGEGVIISGTPNDGDEVLICTERGTVYIDTFCDDPDGCYFENTCEIDGIVAWMPKPEPYKAERSEE